MFPDRGRSKNDHISPLFHFASSKEKLMLFLPFSKFLLTKKFNIKRSVPILTLASLHHVQIVPRRSEDKVYIDVYDS